MKKIARSHGQRLRVFFMDEARFGQQGTLTNVWAEKGSRPTAVKQTKYGWLHLFAAVEPKTGASSALLSPTMNTDVMNLFLRQLVREEIRRDEQVVLIMDQAGWHRSSRLEVPEQMTILLLPPYSPELNPVERVWAFIRSHYMSNRAFAGYDELLSSGSQAWRRLTPKMLRSICRCEYL